MATGRGRLRPRRRDYSLSPPADRAPPRRQAHLAEPDHPERRASGPQQATPSLERAAPDQGLDARHDQHRAGETGDGRFVHGIAEDSRDFAPVRAAVGQKLPVEDGMTRSHGQLRNAGWNNIIGENSRQGLRNAGSRADPPFGAAAKLCYTPAAMELSVVIPVRNEAPNI